MSEVETSVEKHVFEADVAKLLHLMVHSVYSEKRLSPRTDFERGRRLRKAALRSDRRPGAPRQRSASRITLTLDEENARLVIEDNGIGMGRDELVESLGTIARSGTRAFMERIEAAQNKDGAQLIGQFGVGFYSAFMVADNVDVVSRRAGTDKAWHWASDGKGSYTVSAVDLADAPARGTRITLHLMDDAKTFTSRWTVERIVKEQSGHVPVPISIVEKPGAEPAQVADGTALWTKQKSEISKDDYTDFYRGVAGQYDEPALTVHFRAEGRHEYTALAFVPGSKPFDLFDPDRKGRMKLYVKRVFITDEAELLPRYLRFVRGLVDTADLPLNVSREMIQESPLLANIRKGLTNRVLTSIEKLAESDSEAFAKTGKLRQRDQGGHLRRFRAAGPASCAVALPHDRGDDKPRALSDYVKEMKEGQSAIYYLTGDNLAQLKASPQLEGFRARGIEVLLLTCPVDSFWVTTAPDFDGKPFKSITQGAADLAGIAKKDDAAAASPEAGAAVTDFVSFARETLGEAVSDVRTSDRLTESAVCLVAPEQGPDRQLQKMLQGAGRIEGAPKPVLEINPGHQLIAALATCPSEDKAFREDAVKLLLDQARVLDGDRPEDPRAFAERLSRVFGRALKE